MQRGAIRVTLSLLALFVTALPLGAQGLVTQPAIVPAPAVQPVAQPTQPPAQPVPQAVQPVQGAVPAVAVAPVKPKPKPAPKPATALSNDPVPSYNPSTVADLNRAIVQYRAIVARGGWRAVPAMRTAPGQRDASVAALKERLSISGDLPEGAEINDVFDETAAQGLRHFQRRHGLNPTGTMTDATLKALNVPAANRLLSLEKSLERLGDSRFAFGERYVIVNIPSASVELVEGEKVVRRHIAVVGKAERASPMVETRITRVNFHPTWTVPTSIIKKDLIPKMRKDPQTLAKMRIKMLDSKGREVDPRSIDWNTERAANFTLRQDSGMANALGQVRIDMPNREAVYMHDTPSKRLFLADARFHSSGCVRVADVKDFVTWLLAPQGWEMSRVTESLSKPDRKDISLTKPVPVAWVYLTGWANKQGVVQFRDDVYGYDAPDHPPVKVVRPADKVVEPPAEEVPPLQPNMFNRLFGGDQPSVRN